MEPVDQELESIRRYLLGQVTAEEEQRLEEQFMLDEKYREEVLMLEEDLIDDYLSEALTAEERQAFETHWLPFHADRLEVARAINRYGAETPTRSVPTEIPARVPHQVPVIAEFRRKPLVIGLLAAGFLFLVLVGAALIYWQSRQPGNRGRFSEEIARLNDGSNSQLPDRPVILSPVTLRGANEPKINPAVHAPVVHLLLTLPPDQHDSYQVLLRCSNPPEEYKVEHVNAISTNSGRAVMFKIPSALLTRGDYSLEVSGRTSQGAFESVADYSFQISN